MKWAAILFMLIRWSKIKTQLRKSVLRILHCLFVLRIMCALCIKLSSSLPESGQHLKLEAILFMLIRWSKRQNIQLGNRANRIQHTLIKLKSLVPNFY